MTATEALDALAEMRRVQGPSCILIADKDGWGSGCPDCHGEGTVLVFPSLSTEYDAVVYKRHFSEPILAVGSVLADLFAASDLFAIEIGRYPEGFRAHATAESRWHKGDGIVEAVFAMALRHCRTLGWTKEEK